ncbi:CHY zinc finger domain-containing protein [Histoplasma capsulatum var. duboisii H88]|uniref:CHY zinc finger domain-containing protein n=1 Tax=Ajellomyces capsulatus (strain H88) TaxID=544711 RepID=F0UTQ4_AJEC8|nr:CHY zinc finger domain-containing protein [Histoplasma capsulatum var. duboisii H88]
MDNHGQPSPVSAVLASAQPHPTQMDTRSIPARRVPDRKSTRCRYFGSKNGCRAGDACRFAHETVSSNSLTASSENPTSFIDTTNNARVETAIDPEPRFLDGRNEEELTPQVQELTTSPQESTGTKPRAVQRPTPHAQRGNPREFELNQIRRRFHPQERSDEDGTILSFHMHPSDLDLSDNLKSLACAMHVPLDYPVRGMPSLEIVDENVGMREKILIQEEFENITKARISGTLLNRMNVLDRSLTKVFHKENPGQVTAPLGSVAHESEGYTPDQGNLKQPRAATISQEKEQASLRRAKEITQLTSRLERTPLFSKSSDGISFTIPLNPLKPHLIPQSLKSVKQFNLVVPLLYPLEPCHINILGTDDNSARATESSFKNHVIENPNASLTSHVNYLSTMLHTLANRLVESSESDRGVTLLSLNDNPDAKEIVVSSATTPRLESQPKETEVSTELADRPHIQVIPRPPEWMSPKEGNESYSDESDYSDAEESAADSDDDGDGGGVNIPSVPPLPAGRDVALSFPSMELRGIELLELKALHLTLKCERCKDLLDMKNIKIGDDGISIPPKRVESCKKCGNYISLVLTVRGTWIWRDAMQLSCCPGFKIPEVKFLLVSAGGGILA